MKLDRISKLTGTIELVSGLHIGSGDTEMHIGGTDNPVIKNPVTNEPYIPGSSLKGKMRSLMEWKAGVVSVTNGKPLGFGCIDRLPEEQREDAKTILRLFGGAPEADKEAMEALITEIGPGRLAFWDCGLAPEWVKEMGEKHLLLTETKMENSIDRIKGVAEHPRNTERVPAGARFEFRLSVKVIDGEDLLEPILQGLRLLELAGIGGSGSRGYGKITFTGLQRDGEDIQQELARVAL